MAHWIVSSSLEYDDCPPDPYSALDFLFRPIRELLAKRDLRLIDILQRLEVLAVRFEDKVVYAESVYWTKPLRTSSPF